MDHAITIGGLLLTLGLIGGFVALAFGALAVFAGGMSDAPSAGNDATNLGCAFLIAGALLFGGCLWGLL